VLLLFVLLLLLLFVLFGVVTEGEGEFVCVLNKPDATILLACSTKLGLIPRVASAGVGWLFLNPNLVVPSALRFFTN
jgi:hypothetical protein